MRSVIAILLSVLIGAVIYAGLAVGATPEGWLQASMLILPAMLIGIMLIGVVLLPLWSLLAHKTARTRLAFLGVAAFMLLLTGAGLIALGAFERSGSESIVSLLLPALALVSAFAMLMDPRRVRGGRKQTSNAH